MSFLSQLIEEDAGREIPAGRCSEYLRQLESQFKAGHDDPEKPMRIQGQDELVHRLMMAVVLNEHVLLEGLPGVAKTTAVELLSHDTGMSCRRIQFVPDMQPSDLIGKDQINLSALSSTELEPGESMRYWENGPLFENIVIADEINRAPSKVQAALLESMAERAITPFGKMKFVIRSKREWHMWMRFVFSCPAYRRADVWGEFWPEMSGHETIPGEAMSKMSQALAEQQWERFGKAFPWDDRREGGEQTFGATPFDLRNPKEAQFTVFATMNPIEQEGTYPLSEAQTDRFCFKTLVKYPSYRALEKITRMINPPSLGHDPDIDLVHGRATSDEVMRRSLYFFRRCREAMFGQPGHVDDSMLGKELTAGGAGNNGPRGMDLITRIVFYSHMRQPEAGSRKSQFLAQILKDPEQIERQSRLMREDKEHAGLLNEEIWQYVKSGASPRAQMFLTKAAICEMFLDGSESMKSRHIRGAAHDILRHRIRMNVQARVRGAHPEDVVDVLLQRFASVTDEE